VSEKSEEGNVITMDNRLRHAAMTAAAVVLLAGCTVSPNVGSFETSSPVAFNFLTHRKIESFWLARFDQVVKATESAAETLALIVTEREVGPDSAAFRYRDSKAEQFRLVVEQRTAALTSIHIDIGDSGSVALARLFGRQIILELTEAGVFSDEADSESEDGKQYQNL
jgi:hypothetical protein